MGHQDTHKVIFIGGAGRSGSTLLDRMLGSVPGLVSVGEITNIWLVGFEQDFPCGCGETFSRCPFWREVVATAFPPRGEVPVARIAALRSRVQRGAGKLALLSPVRSDAFSRDLARYAAVVQRLLRAVTEVSGARVVVDSSKLPSHGMVLASLPGVQLHVVHLVRDSRAVAHSWQRKKLRRHVRGEPEYLPRLGPLHSALRYYSGNLPMLRLCAPAGGSYTRLRYEDLVADPAGGLGRILAAAGLARAPVDFLHGHAVSLGINHMVDGNPMRHRAGEMKIRRDAAFETGMAPLDRALVTAATLPLRLLYGYGAG